MFRLQLLTKEKHHTKLITHSLQTKLTQVPTSFQGDY